MSKVVQSRPARQAQVDPGRAAWLGGADGGAGIGSLDGLIVGPGLRDAIGRACLDPGEIIVYEGRVYRLDEDLDPEAIEPVCSVCKRPRAPEVLSVRGRKHLICRRCIENERRSHESQVGGNSQIAPAPAPAPAEDAKGPAAPRVPKRQKDRTRWEATWLAVRTQYEQSRPYADMAQWLRKMKPDLACSTDSVADICRAGRAGLLD